jgi:hypothetical protein
MMSQSADTRLATSALSVSLSPKRSSSTATVSFSLTIANTPKRISSLNVFSAFK